MIKSIAFYLPQFHPIQEDDESWGKGFTEWTNVVQAKPLFKGHYQPHLPADLGFYDLRLCEIMEQQADMAKSYGIYGFMFYHYWFSGKRLLETPVNNWLRMKTPNFPFCICWANENWTKGWDGQDQEILIKQEYSEKDDREHFQEMARHFKDDRYIKVEDKPVFAVYRTTLFPDIKRTATIWREEALKYGFKGLYLVTIESFGNRVNPTEIGFDAALEFQPDFRNLPNRYSGSFRDKLYNKLKIKRSPFFENEIVEYSDFVEKMILKETVSYKRFPCVTPMWDNSARRKQNALIINNSSPEIYYKWLTHVIKYFSPYSKEENFIFINAWNEWAEGNHLEP